MKQLTELEQARERMSEARMRQLAAAHHYDAVSHSGRGNSLLGGAVMIAVLGGVLLIFARGQWVSWLMCLAGFVILLASACHSYGKERGLMQARNRIESLLARDGDELMPDEPIPYVLYRGPGYEHPVPLEVDDDAAPTR